MKQFCAFILCAAALICFIPQTEANALSFDPSYVRVKLSTNNAAAKHQRARDYFIKENGAYISGGTLTLRFNMTHQKRHTFFIGEVFTARNIIIASHGCRGSYLPSTQDATLGCVREGHALRLFR